ncbi:MAG TPA: tetratricopeptide repeat protein, partial [Geobacteraceae bacterium]
NLLTLAPIDERILAGLGELYRQAGDQAKHEQTVARLEKLKKLVCPYPATAPLASEGTAELPPPVAPPPLTTPIVDEEEWEEELDLTELEEIDVEPDELTDVSLPEEAVVELELDFEELADEWGEELEGSPPAHPAESFVDFSGELLQEFMNEDRAATAGEPPTAADKYGLAGFFSAFKKGVDAQLDEADTESHYSLGIAYKEMGLYDDAISEFQVASSSPERRLDCLMLQGLCYREKGAPDKALQIFEEALSIPGLGEDELLNIKYELAFSLEAADRPTDACRLYGEIVTVRNDFRDSSDRLQSLAG